MIIRFSYNIPSFYNIQNSKNNIQNLQNNIQKMHDTTVTQDKDNPDKENINTEDKNKVNVKTPEDEE